MWTLLIALASFTPSAGAQPVEPAVRLAGQAMAAPPELAAAMLIQLAPQRTLSLKRRIELIETAFALAGRARQPFPEASPRPPQEPAFDALSLQSLAASELVFFDRAKARELFDAIPSPVPPPLTCKDATAYAVQPYYAAASRIYRHAFTGEEIAKGRHRQFLESLLKSVRTPAQLNAALSTLARFGFPPQADWFAHLASAVPTIHADDRSFTAASGGTIVTALLSGSTKDAAAITVLVTSLRGYLVAHLQAPRCVDSLARSKSDLFLWNSLLRRFDRPLTAEESTPERIIEEKPGVRKDEALTRFRAKAQSLRNAIHETADHDARNRAVMEWLDFLRLSPLRDDNPPEWLRPFHQYFREQDTNGRRHLSALAAASGEPALHAWAEVQLLTATK